MNLTQVQCLYFSPCGTVRKLALAVAESAARTANLPVFEYDLTLPAGRQKAPNYGPNVLTITSFPVYAGRLPNRLLPELQNILKNGCGPAAALAVYGNRSPGDALREQQLLLELNGFTVIAGATFVAEHAFAPALATGRPNVQDFADAATFGAMLPRLAVDGRPAIFPGEGPIAPYYQPKGLDGEPTVFLKAKPITDTAICTHCGRCAQVCPVAAIDLADPTIVPGVCIKCQACIKACPQKAKSWQDAAFLSHQAALQRDFTARKEAAFYPSIK